MEVFEPVWHSHFSGVRILMEKMNPLFLTKLEYFTDIDFPEIAGDFPSSATGIGGAQVV